MSRQICRTMICLRWPPDSVFPVRVQRPFQIVLLGLLWLAAPALAQSVPASTPAVESQPLSLHAAIHLALKRNPNIKAQIDALQAAEAARRAAVGKLYPQIKAKAWYEFFPTQRALLLPRHMDVPTLAEISGATGRQTTQNMLNYQNAQFQDRILNIGLGLNYAIYAGGRISAGIAGARSEARSEAFQLQRVRRQLIFSVTQTYLGILVADKTEQAVRAAIQHMTAVKANIQEFVKVGKKPRLVLLRVETRLQNLRQLLADVRAEQIIVAANLRRLLDLDPLGPPLKLSNRLGEQILLPAPDRPVPATFAQALNSRSDYLALQAKRSAQAARLRQARGARLPELNLSANAWEAHGNHTGGPISTWEPDSQITLSLSVPIFTGGTLNAEVNRQQARLARIANRLEALKQQVWLQVTQAYADLQAAEARVHAAKAGVRSAAEAFRVEREKTAVGVGTATDLLDAQAADLAMQTSYFQALAGYQVAIARVQLATGVLSISFSNAGNGGHSGGY